MKISLKPPMKVNLEKIQYAKSIIEKNIGQNQLIIKNLEPEELHDYQKIMQICEFILVKHENKKALYENLKKFVNTIDSTMLSLESLDEKVNELNISADLSISRLKDFKANLIKSQEDEYSYS
ncbi:MAG: hypothetical protein MK228_05090 [Nitrososphaerales archaeon]|nr:hypothetical protein [Nitrososphaerales archaeon]